LEQIRVEYGVSNPLSALDRLEQIEEFPSPLEGAPPPSRVPRWVGHIAYDAHWSGRRRRLPPMAVVPTLCLARYDAVIAVDHVANKAFIVGDDPVACQRLRRRLDSTPVRIDARIGEVCHQDPRLHHNAICAALEYIRAGDIYQVNLARCWHASYSGSPLALWLRMREQSPVPLGLFFDAGDHVALARTMECFLRWDRSARTLINRPIKGTISRSGSSDQAEAERLRTDPKERAEHAMIVDLMRNDLGRVAEVGSVKVTELLAVEPYAGLSHLVSTVASRTRDNVSLGEVLKATFPPGSVTGAPKLRAIEIIEELEGVSRGIYTGAVGHVDRAGGISFAVAIRTAVISDDVVRYFAGGGIVAYSNVEREIAETELKAQVFLNAVSDMKRNASRAFYRIGATSVL
jgi:anthranilate/para-aminobenzoate synthase component I